MFSQNTNAQTSASQVFSLDSCLAIAIENNPALQASQLKITQQKKLQKTAFDFGKTGVFYENEDLIKDNDSEGIQKIGFSQTIDFPVTLFAQSKYNRQSTRIAKTNHSLSQKELLQNVRSAYFNLWYAVEKQKLFQQQDSIFTDFHNAASLRFSTGEIGKLEMLSAQAKQKEIQLALISANVDVVIAQQELMKLMNISEAVLPVDTFMQKLEAIVISDKSQITSHPFLQSSQQKISLAGFQKSVELTKLLPDLSVRYFNQSWYEKEPGYYGYSFGIGIPLFFWSQQGKIQSAKLQHQIAQKNFENDVLQFNSDYNKAVQEFQKNSSLLNYYETLGMQQADEILNTATLAYKNGEISYLEYTYCCPRALTLKTATSNRSMIITSPLFKSIISQTNKNL